MLPDGSCALPYERYLNDPNMRSFLRISSESYLRQLVGGREGVYEIGKQFRNEGIYLTHNLEFTICAFFMTYMDWNDMMMITENMLSGELLLGL